MNEPEENLAPRKYRWPWFFWGAVVLFIVLAVFTVGFAAHRIATERDPNTPLPGTAPMR
jgi:bacteriorhodopsin